MLAFEFHFIHFFDLLETDIFMEGLKSVQSTPVYTHRSRHLSPLVRTSTLRYVQTPYRNRVWMTMSSMSFNSVSASVHPLEGSKLSHSDNTLPSKGYIYSECRYLQKSLLNLS